MTHVAELNVQTGQAADYVDRLCAVFGELEFETVREGRAAAILLPRGMGTARLDPVGDVLRVRAEAATEQGISALKFMIGLKIEEVAKPEAPEVVWTGYGADFEVLPGFREITVVRNRAVTPLMRRVTFSGRDLGRFGSTQIHVRLLFPPEGLAVPEWPRPGRNGRPAWPPEERRPAARLYTIRAYDKVRDEFDIDFVCHGDGGVAGPWAMSARPGDTIGILGPGGGEFDSADWYLFAGDETAIPAIARHLEGLPANARGVALIEVADAAEQQEISAPPGVELRWLHRDGLEAGRNTILGDAVRGVPWPDDISGCFAWLGAEAATARDIRAYWRDEIGLDRNRFFAVAYWRHELSAENEG